ncbi:MAG: hypothetical protein M3430_21595, partial [Acidobacteriota bacterium]|nr:hypothetical protein [Acidobacteriota bacterium]
RLSARSHGPRQIHTGQPDDRRGRYVGLKLQVVERFERSIAKCLRAPRRLTAAGHFASRTLKHASLNFYRVVNFHTNRSVSSSTAI